MRQPAHEAYHRTPRKGTAIDNSDPGHERRAQSMRLFGSCNSCSDEEDSDARGNEYYYKAC